MRYLICIALAAVALSACGNGATGPSADTSPPSEQSPPSGIEAPDQTAALAARAVEFQHAMQSGDTVAVAKFIDGPNCAGDDRAGYLAAFGNGDVLAAQTVNMRLDTVRVNGTTGVTKFAGLPPESDEYDWSLLNGTLWVIDC